MYSSYFSCFCVFFDSLKAERVLLSQQSPSSEDIISFLSDTNQRMSGAFSATAPRMTMKEKDEEWEKFSEDEQQKALSDLHGQQSRFSIAENPSNLKSALEKLEQQLHLIKDKPAFENAMKECPNYVKSDKFRLMFLRAENFDEQRAAKRLIEYWEEKVELFGSQKAYHSMTLHDLDEEDHMALNGNGLRILPEKDKAGRVVLCSCRSKWHIRNPRRPSMFRTLWFLVHAALKDEAVQRKGIVLVIDDREQGNSPTQSMFDVKRDRVFLKFIRDILPTKIVGIHHIIGGKSGEIYKYIIFPQFLHILGKHLRARYRRHDGGDPNTLLTELDGYGISCRLLVNVGLGQVTIAPPQPQLARSMMRNNTPKTSPTNLATALQDIPEDRITLKDARTMQNRPLNGKRKRSSNKCEDQEDSSKRPTGEAVHEYMHDAPAVQTNGESAHSEQEPHASLQDGNNTVSKALPAPVTSVGSTLVNLAGVVEGAIQKYTVTKKTEQEDTGSVPIVNIEDDDSRQGSCPSGFTSDQQQDENGIATTSKQSKSESGKLQREKQLARNRITARERRKRERELVENLQTSITELTKQNKKIASMNQDLRMQLSHLAGALAGQQQRAAAAAAPFGATASQVALAGLQAPGLLDAAGKSQKVFPFAPQGSSQLLLQGLPNADLLSIRLQQQQQQQHAQQQQQQQAALRAQAAEVANMLAALPKDPNNKNCSKKDSDDQPGPL